MISLRKKKILLSRYNRSYVQLYRRYGRLIIMLVIVIIILALSSLFSLYRHQEKFLIQKVLYPVWSTRLYDDMDFYSSITSRYKGTYYIDTKWFNNDDIVKSLTIQYPFIQDVRIKSFYDNKIVVEPLFKNPLLIAYHNGKDYAIYSTTILSLYSGNTLSVAAPRFYLPVYLSGSIYLSWLFYAQTPEQLRQDVLTLYTLPFSGKVTYMPGWEKYVYRTDTRYIYFNAKKPLSWQIQQLYDLYQYYKPFSSLQRIDIGSSDFPIVK